MARQVQLYFERLCDVFGKEGVGLHASGLYTWTQTYCQLWLQGFAVCCLLLCTALV